MEHWDRLRGDQGFYWDDGLFRPSTDTFLLGGFPVLRRGERACDLGAGTGLLGGAAADTGAVPHRHRAGTAGGRLPSGPAHRRAQRLAGSGCCAGRGPAAAEILPPAGGGSIWWYPIPPLLPAGDGCLSAGDTECRPVGGGVYAGGCVPGRRLAAAVGRALLCGVPHRAAGGADGDGPPFRAGAQAAADGAARRRRGPPVWCCWSAAGAGSLGCGQSLRCCSTTPDGRETAEHRRAYFREEEQAL